MLPPSAAFHFLKRTATFSLRVALQSAVARELKELDGCGEPETSELPRKRKLDEDWDVLEEDCPEFDQEFDALCDLKVLGENRRPSATAELQQADTAFPAPLQATTESGSRKAYKKRQKVAQRKSKRAAAFNQNSPTPSAPNAGDFLEAATTVPIKISVDELPTNSSGYEATNPDVKDGSALDMQELLEEGYALIEWDGRYAFLRTTACVTQTELHSQPLILVDDETEKIFFVGVPKPDDPTYDAACDAVAELLLELGTDGGIAENEFTHTRGKGFAAIRIGIGAGHGPPRPYNLRNDTHPRAAEALRRSPELERLALHQSGELSAPIPYRLLLTLLLNVQLSPSLL